jgi:hypothetical protein
MKHPMSDRLRDRSSLPPFSELDAAADELDRLHAEVERLLEYLSNPLQAEKPCGRCNGRGRRAYASTATFWGGLGGASITDGVCDGCWGSGDEWNKNPNLRYTQGAWLAAWDAEWRVQEARRP